MATIPREIGSEISRVLSGIRNSLDSGYIGRRSPRDIDQLKDAYLKFESIRFTYRSSANRAPNYEQSDIDRLHRDLLDLIEDQEFISIAQEYRYRPLIPGRTPDFILDPTLVEGNIPVSYAIVRLFEALTPLVSKDLREPRQFDIFESATRLEKVIPARQGLAPIQFGIRDGRLIIVDQKSQPSDRDKDGISQAKEELENNGTKIIDHLEKSNCDRRILESFVEMQQQLSSGKNIVRLGLANVGCDIIFNKFSHEIPDAVNAMLKAHTVGVSMYVSQFPEWRRFTEQAALTHLEAADIETLRDSTQNVAAELSKHPEAADPAVPRLLLALKSLLDDPATATQRAAFAVWRSLENLVISIFSYSNSLIKKTAEKLSDELSDKAAKMIVRVLMVSALAAAASLTPIASHLPDGAWLLKAIEIVMKQLDHLAGP